MKPPCYDKPLVNRVDVPTCLHGAPWNDANSQAVMGGDLPTGVTVKNDDNFHLVQDTNPIHLPEVDTDCSGGPPCELKSITVSENIYDSRDALDTGKYPISSSEIKTKLSSRQRV